LNNRFIFEKNRVFLFDIYCLPNTIFEKDFSLITIFEKYRSDFKDQTGFKITD